ncbi:hypothetical protein ACVOMV_15855 [Mesorhizobium atlanticum]
MYDAIEYRGFAQHQAELRHACRRARHNGLTNEAHPTQILADFMTMREFTHKHLSDMTVAFVGEGRDNVALSWPWELPRSASTCVSLHPRSFGRTTSSAPM